MLKLGFISSNYIILFKLRVPAHAFSAFREVLLFFRHRGENSLAAPTNIAISKTQNYWSRDRYLHALVNI